MGRRNFDDGTNTSDIIIMDDWAKEPLLFNDKALGIMTREISAHEIKIVPGFRYWQGGGSQKMSRSENQCGYYQRAWEFYWCIRLGLQTGNACVGIGTGAVNAPGQLTTDKFCGESPHLVRYPSPNAYSHMTLDADAIPWPFHSDKMGGVIFNHSFEHLDSQEVALREAYRITKPGGCVCILMPDVTYCGRGRVDPTHTDEWAADQFLEWVQSLHLPYAKVVAHNTLQTDFSFDTVIRKTKELI